MNFLARCYKNPVKSGDTFVRKEFSANTVIGAKRIASSYFPTVRGKWRRHSGFEYIKQDGEQTIYLIQLHGG